MSPVPIKIQWGAVGTTKIPRALIRRAQTAKVLEVLTQASIMLLRLHDARCRPLSSSGGQREGGVRGGQ